ncbi:hypothetical protein HWV00_02990 [Moritella sp. 24]|uniref:DUF6162 family protein n=1 Tax=Moritella sp. 24 TaxID=2746230 RepID=UPI001BA4680C|nr:hypothetical protein [Moritella sp. 24]QUM75277.1 hypothetical protein HWV00_02990 [Moritella sp. 24]
MISQSVHPDDGGREGKWVALIIITILVTAALLLPYHQTASSEQELASHQVSIKDLPSVELAMIAELRLAHEEIRNIHQDSLELENVDVWPDMAELDELWLAPFIIDKSWERKGKHAWRKVAPALYQGIPALTTGSAAVLLNSQDTRPDVWLALDMPVPTPVVENDLINESGSLDTTALINAGWKQVVFAGDASSENTEHADNDSH